jgi:geranylgeranyl transferase type-2 subunit alpha
MHGRPKLDRPPTSAEITADQQKSLTYQRLVDIMIMKRSQHDYSSETFELIGQLLTKNPDFYSLWNYRREILLTLPIGDKEEDLCTKELSLSTTAIKKNPKSYGAWYHRIWILQRYNTVANIDQEMQLCNQFLDADQRNFHCWNYRRHLIDTFHRPIDSEYKYTTQKLSENFSNYSSYHHRSVYLPRYLSSFTFSSLTDLTDILDTEFQLIESAIFTEPDDQSAWWYNIFIIQYLSHLLVSSLPSAPISTSSPPPVPLPQSGSSLVGMTVALPSFPSNQEDWLALSAYLFKSYLKQYDGLRELYGLESSCKWILIGLLTLIQSMEQILEMKKRVQQQQREEIESGEEWSWDAEEKCVAYEEFLRLLCEVDSSRVNCHQYRFGRGRRA